MAVKEQEHEGSAWASNSNRYPDDMLLRVHGFQIESRPEKGPVMWRDKEGKLWTHKEAISLVKG